MGAGLQSAGVASDEQLYHIGFGRRGPARRDDDRPAQRRSGRSELIASTHLAGGRELARNRGLDSFAGTLPGGAPVVCATSGMGAPSMSIVVNELVQTGITTIIRIGTSGSIQDHVRAGEVVIGSGALTNQGAALDIAPPEFPAVADPFLTVALAGAATELGVAHHVGVMASVDTFFEGQERSASSANKHLLRRLRGMIDEYQGLGVLNFEMEAGTLFKMGVVYGFAAAACAGSSPSAARPRSRCTTSRTRRSTGDPRRRRGRRPLERPLSGGAMADDVFTADDLLALGGYVAERWTAGADRDWSVPAGTLEWSCTATADHAVDCVFAPAMFLASRRTDRYPDVPIFTAGPDATVAQLVESLAVMCRILVDVVAGADPDRPADPLRRRRRRSPAAQPTSCPAAGSS